MSAKKAAASLIANDPFITARAMAFETMSFSERDSEGENLLKDVMGTWTLTLAADAAGVTEEQVIGAIAYQLRLGSTLVARGIAHRLFRDK